MCWAGSFSLDWLPLNWLTSKVPCSENLRLHVEHARTLGLLTIHASYCSIFSTTSPLSLLTRPVANPRDCVLSCWPTFPTRWPGWALGVQRWGLGHRGIDKQAVFSLLEAEESHSEVGITSRPLPFLSPQWRLRRLERDCQVNLIFALLEEMGFPLSRAGSRQPGRNDVKLLLQLFLWVSGPPRGSSTESLEAAALCPGTS